MRNHCGFKNGKVIEIIAVLSKRLISKVLNRINGAGISWNRTLAGSPLTTRVFKTRGSRAPFLAPLESPVRQKTAPASFQIYREQIFIYIDVIP